MNFQVAQQAAISDKPILTTVASTCKGAADKAEVNKCYIYEESSYMYTFRVTHKYSTS